MKTIVKVVASYDRSPCAGYRGWVVEVTFDDGLAITIPAAPTAYFLPPSFEPRKIAEETKHWLIERSHEIVGAQEMALGVEYATQPARLVQILRRKSPALASQRANVGVA